MISSNQVEQVVKAIYRVEGSEHTRFPYGIKSIKTTNPHNACFNTVNHFCLSHRIVKIDRYFIYALSNQYCPLSVDQVGNANWRVNMVRILHL